MDTDKEKIAQVCAVLDGEPLMMLPGYVILIKKPKEDDFYGIVECSFSMDFRANQTFFYWSSIEGSTRFRQGIDGKSWVEKDAKHWNGVHPDWEFKIYDARDKENLPIVIDWSRWLDAHQPADTMSGVRNKYDARNVHFRPKNS